MNSRGRVDFTLAAYGKLLGVLIGAGYSFQRFCDFIESPQLRVIILRHDVDRLPENSMVFARLQGELEIRATYYFRWRR
jgi:hypothetical protein